MIWAKFDAGSRVWHEVERRALRQTLCGRRFERSPILFREEDLTLSELEGACYRCVELASLRKGHVLRPLARAKGAGR